MGRELLNRLPRRILSTAAATGAVLVLYSAMDSARSIPAFAATDSFTDEVQKPPHKPRTPIPVATHVPPTRVPNIPRPVVPTAAPTHEAPRPVPAVESPVPPIVTQPQPEPEERSNGGTRPAATATPIAERISTWYDKNCKKVTGPLVNLISFYRGEPDLGTKRFYGEDPNDRYRDDQTIAKDIPKDSVSGLENDTSKRCDNLSSQSQVVKSSPTESSLVVLSTTGSGDGSPEVRANPEGISDVDKESDQLSVQDETEVNVPLLNTNSASNNFPKVQKIEPVQVQDDQTGEVVADDKIDKSKTAESLITENKLVAIVGGSSQSVGISGRRGTPKPNEIMILPKLSSSDSRSVGADHGDVQVNVGIEESNETVNDLSESNVAIEHEHQLFGQPKYLVQSETGMNGVQQTNNNARDLAIELSALGLYLGFRAFGYSGIFQRNRIGWIKPQMPGIEFGFNPDLSGLQSLGQEGVHLWQQLKMEHIRTWEDHGLELGNRGLAAFSILKDRGSALGSSTLARSRARISKLMQDIG